MILSYLRKTACLSACWRVLLKSSGGRRMVEFKEFFKIRAVHFGGGCLQ
jgi:hypothetical protein